MRGNLLHVTRKAYHVSFSNILPYKIMDVWL